MCKLKTVVGLNIGLFSLISLVHLSRLLWQWPVTIGNWPVPLWLNGIGVVVAGGLAYLNSKHLQQKERG